jgi:hypothetical protein
MAHKRKYETIKLKLRKPWEVPTGHREDRKDTTMDHRPKRMRTRRAIDNSWRNEYDI